MYLILHCEEIATACSLRDIQSQYSSTNMSCGAPHHMQRERVRQLRRQCRRRKFLWYAQTRVANRRQYRRTEAQADASQVSVEWGRTRRQNQVVRHLPDVVHLKLGTHDRYSPSDQMEAPDHSFKWSRVTIPADLCEGARLHILMGRDRGSVHHLR